MNAVRMLLLVAIASPFIAFLSSGQDPVNADWSKDVDKACTAARYGMRLAAARKVAGGGGAAVPAVREFAKVKGVNEVSSPLVSAIADDAGVDAAVLELLREWAQDYDFYWRAEAMRGLALRAPKLPEPAKKQLHDFFVPYWDDAAWLTRTYARFGGILLDDQNAEQLPEPDPRARAKIWVLQLQHGKDAPIDTLLELLGEERTFQGDPWGQRVAAEVHKALKAWLGDDYPAIEGGDTAGALAAMHAAVEKKAGKKMKLPQAKRDPPTPFAGGIEILSCKHGDLFLQWTADGALYHGLDVELAVKLPAEVWQRLDTARKALEVPTTMGTVVCDAMRLRWSQPDVHAKAAPQSLPAPVTEWLRELARALDEKDRCYGTNGLRTGLEQFAAP